MTKKNRAERSQLYCCFCLRHPIIVSYAYFCLRCHTIIKSHEGEARVGKRRRRWQEWQNPDKSHPFHTWPAPILTLRVCVKRHSAHGATEGPAHRPDHHIDHLHPNLPLRDVVQDLHSTGSTQETSARSCRRYGSHPETWASSQRSGREAIPALKHLEHQVGDRWSVGCVRCARNKVVSSISSL